METRVDEQDDPVLHWVRAVMADFKARREWLGISQNYLEVLSGVDHSTICRIEAGYFKDIKLSTYIRLCVSLGIEPGEFLPAAKDIQEYASTVPHGKDSPFSHRADLSLRP